MNSLQERSSELIKQFQDQSSLDKQQLKQSAVYSYLQKELSSKVEVQKIDGIKQFIVETKEKGDSILRGINVVNYELGVNKSGNQVLIPKEHTVLGDKFVFTADIWTRKFLIQMGMFCPSYTAKVTQFETLKLENLENERTKCIRGKNQEGQEIQQCIQLTPYITNQYDHKAQNLPKGIEVTKDQTQLVDLPVDGMPIIGKIGGLQNLYLNVGLFIFTDLAFASSELVGQIIFGKKPSILPFNFDPQRFSTMKKTEY